jgi:hypothetical protein
LEDNFRIKRKNLTCRLIGCRRKTSTASFGNRQGNSSYAATVIKFISSGKRIEARLRTILDVGSTSINDPAELPFHQLDVLNTLQELGR